MKDNGSTFAWAVALFTSGVLLLTPPLARIFDAPPNSTVLGVPLFYAFLFLIWLVLIALTAVLARRVQAVRARGAPQTEAEP